MCPRAVLSLLELFNSMLPLSMRKLLFLTQFTRLCQQTVL